jgi:hypothetical protein
VFEHERRLAGIPGETGYEWNEMINLVSLRGDCEPTVLISRCRYSESPSILNSQMVLNVFQLSSLHYNVKMTFKPRAVDYRNVLRTATLVKATSDPCSPSLINCMISIIRTIRHQSLVRSNLYLIRRIGKETYQYRI